MSKQKVQSIFGASADAYVTSKVHAKGASLSRVVELLDPQADWRVLDVATGAGHMAFSLAPHVQEVVATDITPEMLERTAVGAQEHGLRNIIVETADAENLPFPTASFDVVACRIAAHHFSDVGRFVAEAVRVLAPGGWLVVVDNVVPGSRLRGKKADVQREAGRYVNAFEKLRDPSHGRCLSLEEWADQFRHAGLALVHQEALRKEMDFASWTDRLHVAADTRLRLQVMLLQAPTAVSEFLTPTQSGDRITFYLTEAILIGRLGTEEAR
ncbi:MAG: methyltransferase domain-containing protein [Ardenticatenaceae bacterium]|nr:methyltransferase domain-containing protein [Ardenticatenaceae bacterium]